LTADSKPKAVPQRGRSCCTLMLLGSVIEKQEPAGGINSPVQL
jgi:hypothetical protein